MDSSCLAASWFREVSFLCVGKCVVLVAVSDFLW